MSTKGQKKSGSQTAPEDQSSVGILNVLDTLAKLAAAGAIIFAAFIANTYQAKMTAITVISQREQAETELRATMFSNLIGPIVGPNKNGRECTPKREKLLVELLAFNFHEHFEFKPLLTFVDKRLKDDKDSTSVEKERRSLRSVARRITSRQIASLLKEGSRGDRTIIHQLTFVGLQQDHKEMKPDENTGGTWEESYLSSLLQRPLVEPFGEFIRLESPDKKWTLDISAERIVSDNESVVVRVNMKSNSSTNRKEYDDIPREFTLTPFDFPLTDHTLLADGNRFAVVIDNINFDDESNAQIAILKLIWFPKRYFSLRERPINHADFLEKLGVQMDIEPDNEE